MYVYLWQHPEIYFPVHKEPQFFGRDLKALAGAIREEELYLQLFAGAGGRPRAGEASVWYLFSKTAAREIRAFAPAAKIIALVRNPVQMAYSLYSLFTRSGNEDLPTFEASLAAEPERRLGRSIPSGAYFPQGLIYTDVARYAAQVERYFEAFGRENVHCILFDDLVRDTAAVYRRTLEFLGVDPEFAAELDRRKANQWARMQGIRQLRSVPPEIRSRMQFDHIKLHADGPRPLLPAELAAQLRELFAEDVAQLGALLGRDLSAWTKGEAMETAKEPSRAPARVVLAGLRALKSFSPELRAKHDKVETLERKFARWQKMRVPELALEQRLYNPAWATWFSDEKARIAGALGPRTVRVEHFGSTSVPGLSSKNILDIAVGLEAPFDAAEAEKGLARIGYESYGNSPVDPETVWLWKLEKDRAFVIHLCAHGRPWIGEQVDMREYLRAHPEERDRYAELKRRLAEEKDKDLLGYSLRKLATTVELVDKAQQWRAGLSSPDG